MSPTLIAIVVVSIVFITWMLDLMFNNVLASFMTVIGVSSFILMFSVAIGSWDYVVVGYGVLDVMAPVFGVSHAMTEERN